MAITPVRSTQKPSPSTRSTGSSAKATSAKQLDALYSKSMILFDDRSDLSKATTLKSTKSTGLGVTDVDKTVRTSSGAAFHVAQVGGPTSSEGGTSSGSFGDTRAWLILDRAGIDYMMKNATVSKVKGQRLTQVKAEIAKPSQGTPSFTLPNGSKAIAFIGEVFAQTKAGDIVRYGLSENDDGLDS